MSLKENWLKLKRKLAKVKKVNIGYPTLISMNIIAQDFIP